MPMATFRQSSLVAPISVSKKRARKWRTSSKVSLGVSPSQWRRRFMLISPPMLHGGAVPLDRGRRPRRPVRARRYADVVVQAAGPGGPARTRGSAPPTPRRGCVGRSCGHHLEHAIGDGVGILGVGELGEDAFEE